MEPTSYSSDDYDVEDIRDIGYHNSDNEYFEYFEHDFDHGQDILEYGGLYDFDEVDNLFDYNITTAHSKISRNN